VLANVTWCLVAFGFVDYEDRRDAEVTISQFFCATLQITVITDIVNFFLFSLLYVMCIVHSLIMCT